MLKFVVEITSRDQGYVYSRLVVVEAECPELEKVVHQGGYGGGPNGDDFLVTRILGAEVKTSG